MKVNKKNLIPFLFYYFTNIFFAQNYIKAEVKSFQYEEEPKSISNIYFDFDEANYLTKYNETIKSNNNKDIIFDYRIKEQNGNYIINITSTNNYINSEPNMNRNYCLIKKDDCWVLQYQNQDLGELMYSTKDNKCYFYKYKTNEKEEFYSYENNIFTINLGISHKYKLMNNIFYELNSDSEYQIVYNYETETYDIFESFEGLESECHFSRNYYCTDFNQICLMWIMRYDFEGFLLPYLFCKLDRAYHASSYLTEVNTTYEPEHLQQKDGLPWASGNGKGLGEKISIKEFENKNPTVLRIINGYQDKNHPDYYKNNSRVKKIKITNTDTKKSKTIKVKDRKEEQLFQIDDLGPGQNYDIEILAVYPGKKYDDLCIQYLVVE